MEIWTPRSFWSLKNLGLTELLLNLGSQLFFIYLIIIIGIIWRFSRFFTPNLGKWFTNVTIWIFFPITIIFSILTLESTSISIFLGIGILALLIHVISYFSILFLSKPNYLFREKTQSNLNNQQLGAQALSAMFPNALIYPFPIILAVIGEKGIPYATIFVFFVIIFRNSLGVYIGIEHSNESLNSPLKINTQKMILETLKFPPFVATLIGFFFLLINGPQDFQSPVITLSKDISLWGSLILIGISFQDLSQLKPENLFSQKTQNVAFVRFFVSIVVGTLFVWFWQFSSVIAFTLLIQCMGPPAVSNIIYGKFFNLSEDEISIYTISVTLIGLLLLPLEILVLSMLFPL